MGNYNNELYFKAKKINIRTLEDWMEDVSGEEDELEEVEAQLKTVVEDWDLDDDTLITMCMDILDNYLGSSAKDMSYHYVHEEGDIYELITAYIH